MLFSSPFFCSDDPTSILSFRWHCDIALFNHHPVLSKVIFFSLLIPFNWRVVLSAQVLFILSSSYSIPFLFNRSAARSCSSLFLFSNRVFSTLFISVVFFSRNGLTFSRFFGFTRLSKKQLSFTASLSLSFSLRCHSRSRDEILS